MTIATVFAPGKNLARKLNDDRLQDLYQTFWAMQLFQEADAIGIYLCPKEAIAL
jgi:hypothetical protein